jgi:transcriptional regulator with XRE-family HTH domain
MSDIPASLRGARTAAGLSQQELARRRGLPQSQISRAERGEDLRLSTLRDIARGLDLEVVLVPLKSLRAVNLLLRDDDRTEEAPARFAASSERDPE